MPKPKLIIPTELTEEQMNKLEDLFQLCTNICREYVKNSIEIFEYHGGVTGYCGGIFLFQRFHERLIIKGIIKKYSTEDFMLYHALEKISVLIHTYAEERNLEKLTELLKYECTAIRIQSTNDKPVIFEKNGDNKNCINIPELDLVLLPKDFVLPKITNGDVIRYITVTKKDKNYVVRIHIEKGAKPTATNNFKWLDGHDTIYESMAIKPEQGLVMCFSVQHFLSIYTEDGCVFHLDNSPIVKALMKDIFDLKVYQESMNLNLSDEDINQIIKQNKKQIKKRAIKIIENIFYMLENLTPTYITIPSLTGVSLGYSKNKIPRDIRDEIYLRKIDEFYKNIAVFCKSHNIELRVVGRNNDVYNRCYRCGKAHTEYDNNFFTPLYSCACHGDSKPIDRIINSLLAMSNTERDADVRVENDEVIHYKKIHGKYTVYDSLTSGATLYNLCDTKENTTTKLKI